MYLIVADSFYIETTEIVFMEKPTRTQLLTQKVLLDEFLKVKENHGTGVNIFFKIKT